LGEAGYRVECFCYGKYTDYVLGSKYISFGKSFDSCPDAVDYLVNDYPVKAHRPVLFTLPDPPAYYVDLHQDALKEKFILFSAGEPGKVVYWMDKSNISNLARKHGFTVPWSLKLSKGDPFPRNLDYPVFTKSANSTEGGKVDEGICRSEEELKARIEGMVSKDFLVMQYIRKVKEINYFGIAIKDHVYIDYHDLRERFPVDGYGYYNSFHLCEYDEMHDRMVNMIKETGYQGLFDVEFLVPDDGKMYFTEVNFRVDGEVYKMIPGINMPDYWCKLVDLPEGMLPERLETKKNGFWGMTEINDFKISVLSGKVGFFKWLYQFITADKLMLLNFRDPRPAMIRLSNSIKSRLHISHT
jgi:D-aspartate ligase